MFLKKLIIEKNDSIIREIKFIKGINLIVDETSSDDKQESGNNVGKTTVLRLIDFCLGGKGENIYKDSEFKDKGQNTLIENFLTENNVVINLILKDDLEIESTKEVKIRRNFLKRTDKLQEINGESFNNVKFQKELNYLIFNSKKDKPTFRQLISKNVRDEKNRLIHTLKVLHPTTKAEEYEALYFFWLGIEINSSERKQKLYSQLKVERDLIKRLSKETNLSEINQALIVINRNIATLEEEKDRFTINKDYEKDLDDLNKTKLSINKLSVKNSSLVLRRNLILESKAELDNEISNIDTEQIKSLYNEAKTLLPNLQKTFEDTLEFHNKMLEEKRTFIEKELPELENKLKENQKTLSDLLNEEDILSQKLQKLGLINSLQEIVKKLNDEYEKKGSFEEQKKLWESSNKRIEDFETELHEIDAGIHSKEDLLEDRIAKFNEYFTDISYKLYGEQFILSQERNEKGYELNISSISGNPGTGKKKGEIVSFDLAYIQFADALNIDCLHFVLNDQIETVHDNQISTLLTEVIKDVNCQYVLPVLRDKLPADVNVSDYEILSLSQSEKLFKI